MQTTTIERFQNVPVRRLVWKLGAPAMLVQFLNVLYGLVDRFFVSRIQGEGYCLLRPYRISVAQ